MLEFLVLFEFIIVFRIAIFHFRFFSLLMPSLLECCYTAQFITSPIDDLVLFQLIVDGSLYLGLLVISFLSLLFCTIHRLPVKMRPSCVIFTLTW